MPVRTNGGVFNDQMVTGSLRHFVLEGADFSGAINAFGQPVPGSAAEIIFTNISEDGFIDIMNPNSFNISFALEINRSQWDASTLTMMVQSLGSDVGVDHINCTICTVTEVPYIWNLGSGSGGSADYQPIPPGTSMVISTKYYVTSAGTVTLPSTIGAGFLRGHAVLVTKPATSVIFIGVGNVLDTILTDLGTTDMIEMDITQELIFIYNGANGWELQY